MTNPQFRNILWGYISQAGKICQQNHRQKIAVADKRKSMGGTNISTIGTNINVTSSYLLVVETVKECKIPFLFT